MKKNKILGSLLAMAAVLCVSGQVATQELNKVEAAVPNRTIYLDLWDWDNDSNAFFEAWAWGGTNSGSWHSIVDSNGDGSYELIVPSDTTGIKILRKDKNNHSSKQWQSWNEFGNIDINANKDFFIATGWGSTDSWEWSNYVNLKGTLTNWESGEPMIDTDYDGIYDLYLKLDAGEYEFKVYKWYDWLGNSGSFSDECSGWTMDKDSNCKLKATGGEYKFSYNLSTNKISVTYLTKQYSNEAKQLFTKYYNLESYTKDSILNTNITAEAEVKEYFHASANDKYRRTEYTPTSISMTTSKDDETYTTNPSVYSNGDNCVIHTGDGGNYTVTKYSSVDDWFTTLNDFATANSTGWEYANGVYTYNLAPTTIVDGKVNEDSMTKYAREFVAPMWLAPTTTSYSYVTYTKLTVQEIDNQLVMKLYVAEGNSGLLVDGANLVLSQVTIY